MADRDTARDGVRLAILSNRFESVARKMANTLMRTGRSGVLNTARDFSCCIITRDDELLATAESLPIHVLAGPDLMAKSMKQFHPELKRGDAFLHNSPYHGCSHPADHTILVPVIDDDGVHHFTVLAKAHQADIGNSVPTTYVGHARDVYEEGALIFPAVRIQKDYRNIEDIIRMCRMRIRVPDQWWGDYLAMMGAARIGEREILALAKEVGWAALHDYTGDWFAYSEQRMIEAVKALPSGRARKTSTHDPFPGTPPEGIPITIKLEIKSEEGIIEVDLRDNPDNHPCGLNLSEACARTAAMIGVFNSLDHRVPKNAGSFRRIKLHLREGCVVGIPKHPTSCSVATTNVADRVSNPIQCAIAEIAEGQGMAECGAIIPPSMGVISGIDPRTKEAFVNQIFVAITGGAGSPTQDAWLTICHVGNAGLCMIDNVEIDELHFPMKIHSRRMIPDTEGAGTYRGASSVFAEYGPTDDCVMEVGYVSDGHINFAKGVRGGGPGGRAEQHHRRRNGASEPLPACAQIFLEAGESVISHTGGGGGYGRPTRREVERVRHDVEEGWITTARAADVYGVVLDESGTVDAAATDARRAPIEDGA